MAEQTKITVKDVQVVREGTKIIIPPKMEWPEVIEWCQRKQREDETEVAIHHNVPYSPLDGAVALHKAMAEIYGWAEMVPTPGWFGPQPPTMVRVPIGVDKAIQVPWGRINIPGIAGWLGTGIKFGEVPTFLLTGVVRQKHKHQIEEITEKMLWYLKNDSIYRKKAIRVDFSWVDNEEFDPTENCPKFISLDGVGENDLILSEAVEDALKIGLFTPIQCADACRRYKIPLKRGILLYGPYGTGKSMCANITAQKAVRHGFTFIYLEHAGDLKHGLRFAAQYAPAVVFSEDIDRAVEGERTVDMDEILNTLDGIDTKGGEIITVLTTNHIDDINPALLRMGRLDSLIEVTPPDKDAAIRLVKLYGRGLFDPKVNFEKVGKALTGQIPAFIREVTERAKLAAIDRLSAAGKLEAGIEGHVVEEDLLSASSAMQMHASFLKPRIKEVKNAEVLVKLPAGHKQSQRVLESIGANGDD